MAKGLANTKYPQIGEIYLMMFEGTGSEQAGWRPGLVFQNNTGNMYSPNIIALPLTSNLKKAEQPTHVIIRANDSGLLKDSMVLCENPQRMSKENIGKFITKLSDEYMRQVTVGNLLATSAIGFLDLEAIEDIWKRALELNATMA